MAQFSRELLERYARIRKDPIEWLKCVYTKDQADRQTRKFPIELDYARLYATLWTRERFIAVPKSRRMVMSWENVALYLWDSLFNSGITNAFVSKKEDDANELIDRAEFIYDHIPEDLIPRALIPAKSRKFGELSFKDIGSKIQGFPQGADQLRQHGFSGILADEMAFWEHAQAMYSGSIPTLQGADGKRGGRFTAISTRAPSFFKRIVFDTVEELDTDAGTVPIAPVTPTSPMPGVQIWKNPKNKFMIYQLHYSANPVKRTREWKEQASSGMPRAQWLQEFEENWDSFEGTPVYPDFDPQRHLSLEPITPTAGLPLLRGWDFGLTPACIVAQLVGDTLVVLGEFTELNMGAERFSEMVLGKCSALWPEWNDRKKHWRDFIDPSGAFRKDTDEGSCAKILRGHGLTCHPGPVAFEERKKAVEHFLVRHTHNGPCFLANELTAPVLVRGFRGGYRYPEKAIDVEPSKLRPVKDEHSHPHDGLQYIASHVMMMRNRPGVKIPPPAYFSRQGANGVSSA